MNVTHTRRAHQRAWDLDHDPAAHWADRAACRHHDPELWTLLGGRLTQDNRVAIKICRGCPVQRDCYADAVAQGADGVIRSVPFTNYGRPSHRGLKRAGQ